MAANAHWTPEAEEYLRANFSHPDWQALLEGLAKYIDPCPSRHAVYYWMRRNGLNRSAIKAPGKWVTPELRAWLEPRWKRDGWSGPALADGVERATGRVIDARVVTDWCAKEFGPRETPVTLVVRSVMPPPVEETRTRRCSRCRSVVQLPRYRFRCDQCVRYGSQVADLSGYRAAGLRVA